MELVIDVGNSETVLGVVKSGTLDLHAHWRLSTPIPRTPDEYGLLLRALLRDRGIAHDDLTMAVLGSVVPSATRILADTLEQIVGQAPIVVDARSPLPIQLDVDEPLTVGADRIVNTLAVKEMYGRDTIAVDLGTATTFDCITADGAFVGGVIAQGLQSGLEWLGRKTAKLPRVELAPPESVIGRRTEACIQSGVFFLGGRCCGRHRSADSGGVATGRRLCRRDRRIRHDSRPSRPDRGAHRTLPHASTASLLRGERFEDRALRPRRPPRHRPPSHVVGPCA